ncbi:MAG: peptidoglycan DD-metalloendopeptidase family protein [Dehalococcoidales bacterium]|nr:peptidoglycan DD-metalloendopeptidase family protein [Dehalococcoidales bacterium]
MLDHPPLHREFGDFCRSLYGYIRFRLKHSGLRFEKVKNFVVDVLLAKRGANTSIFVHLSVVTLAIAVLIAGGFISSGAVISGSYPGVAANPLVAGASATSDSGVISSSITPVTIISDKPRDKAIEYEVKSGDTVSSIARDFGVSENTILWENDLTSGAQIKAGDLLRILPVSGIAYKVAGGDTIYSIAKTYQANAQAILDFPFNDIGDDFQLKTGQTLIIPDGAPPEKPKPAPTQYLAQEQQNIAIANLGSAQFAWPVTAFQQISQYFSWYHPGIDMANLGGGPIYAADSGTVTVAGWPDNQGYGNRIAIDHGNGFTTLYAHLSAASVSPGQKVSKGQLIGMMGSTGRSTGNHLHFEIRKDGVLLNPLSFLGK